MINAAIVGLGGWGQTLVTSVQGKSDHIRFTTGVTRTPARAEEFCREHDIALGDDYAAMLADPNVDAVVLATPNTRHCAEIVAAAEAGKHVFCEKPFTMTAADADTALEALATRGLKAGVGHNRRFAPNTIELKRLMDAGELGQAIHIEGQFAANLTRHDGTWRTSRTETPAGGMTSLGIHLVDMFIHLFGRIAEVDTRSRRIAMPYDVDDSTAVLVDFEDGRIGTLGTVSATASMWRVRVFASQGWVELSEQNRLERLMVDFSRDEKVWPGLAYPSYETIGAGLDAFAADVDGGPAFPITPDEIRHGVAVFEAIVRSDETGERVRVG
jgi:predicted dehydrogenase